MQVGTPALAKKQVGTHALAKKQVGTPALAKNITETESSTKVGEIQKLKEEILLMLRALGKLIEAENMDAPERALMNIGLFKK